MKRTTLFFPAIAISSLLFAQKGKTKITEPIAATFATPTDKYKETFDNNKTAYAWRQTGDLVVKNDVYEIVSSKPGVGYLQVILPYYPFRFLQSQDWVFEVSMKKISGITTAQWGIEIGEWGKPGKINIWMDKGGAYGTFGHIKFKIKKDFNDMKLVKTGEKLDVYFNGDLKSSGKIDNINEGGFGFSVTEASGSDKTIIQFDNVSFEITKKAEKPIAATTAVTTPENAIRFTDNNFKAVLIAKGADINKDGEIQKSEALLVATINVHNKGITSLEGIQYFENLTDLNCATNAITSLDLTKNTKLKELFCKGNRLVTLDISKNILLKSVVCSSNLLTELDATGIKYLKTIECASNNLTKIKVSGLASMTWLDCRWNKLSTLDVTGCISLEKLKCENNLIQNILYSPLLAVDEYEKEWTKDNSAVWVRGGN